MQQHSHLVVVNGQPQKLKYPNSLDSLKAY